MNKEIVIDINQDGSAQAMHMDQFDLGFLGKKQVERASDIIWDDMEEGWKIVVSGHRIPVNEYVCRFVAYELARRFEVSWFQACRKAQVDPHSEEGAAIAKYLRTEHKG